MREISRRNLLGERLDEILHRYGVDLDGSDRRRLPLVYEYHLRRPLREPRQIKRYCE